jgi:23S rRNA (adenine2030-N6)-methyltransferase
MFVVNPPWTLKAALEQSLPWLADVLGLDEMAGWQIQAGTGALEHTSAR